MVSETSGSAATPTLGRAPLDAVQAGYNTTVIAELTAGIAEDPEEVFEELEAAGVEVERP